MPAIGGPRLSPQKGGFRAMVRKPIDLPGRWYMQTIVQLSKENRLAKGSFMGLGRRLNPKDIACPVDLLAGESDDITTKEQVFDAEKYLGTPKNRIEKKLAGMNPSAGDGGTLI
jgi:poly(3-hydroxyalkanoate) synthetase